MNDGMDGFLVVQEDLAKKIRFHVHREHSCQEYLLHFQLEQILKHHLVGVVALRKQIKKFL